MAEGVLSNIASKVIEVLGSQVFQEIELACGVKDEIRELKSTVETVNAVLLDAEEQHIKKNRQVTLWLEKLKYAFYDADDLLDDFFTELKERELMASQVRVFFSKSNQIAYNLKMAHKVKAIRKRLDKIANDRKFHLNERLVEKTEREKTHSFIRSEDVIGRDDDKIAIIKLLLDSNYVENVSVVPIVGIGGLGKTTLAQLVYNDEIIKKEFDLRMWVCVSDNFDLETIVKNIIKSAGLVIKSASGREIQNPSIEQLQGGLRKHISRKRYLLVLDDLWNDNRESWLKLKTMLMNDKRGSNILITTRSRVVASITTELPFYVLRGLSEDRSWSLFKLLAFEQGVEPQGADLVRIGKCIVEKCAGVPLAIRTVARLLYYNNTEAYWLHFMEVELSTISQEESDILPTLKISYDHIPSHLKQCFTYCALFPKDSEIKKESLIYLWMAQGFLQSSNTKRCLEDVGNEYFMNLVSRSFLEVVKYDDLENAITCKMHDLMHDLATSVAKSECILVKWDAINVDERTRHISLFDPKLELSCDMATTMLRANRIRTLLCKVGLDDSNCNKIISGFRYLRTLHLSHLQIRKVPNSIAKLKHLWYLDLSNNYDIRKLPNSITMLRKLQVLKLCDCESLMKLPSDIKKMLSLRCLMIDGCKSLHGMPRELGLLISLRTLNEFLVGPKFEVHADLSELNQLNNLRGSLSIKRLNFAVSDAGLANLKEKKHLDYLKLQWYPGGETCRYSEAVLKDLEPHQNLKKLCIYEFPGVTIANWLSCIRYLTAIEIISCRLCQHLLALDELSSLKSLHLESLSYLEYISEKAPVSTSFFESLKELRIIDCGKLKGWWRIDDVETIQITKLPSFPCLFKLEVTHCFNLTTMPLFPSLEELTLGDASWKPLQMVMMLINNVPPSTSSNFAGPLSNLKSLYIWGCDDFDLVIDKCGEQWENLTSLHSIKFELISGLVSLPNGLQRVTTLQHLEISLCDPFSAQRGIGVEWPKIAHIPNIKIDDQWIQKDGFYQLN